MQLEGATRLERELYDVCLECERTMPASDFETRLVVALSEASNELQRLRLRDEQSGETVAGLTAKAADAREEARHLCERRDDAVAQLDKLADLLADSTELRVSETLAVVRLNEIIEMLGGK